MSSTSIGRRQVRTAAPPAGALTPKSMTGFGFVDGVGHLGGGIGVLVIAPQIPNMTVLEAMLVVSGFLVLAAIVAQFSPNTRGRYYEEISP